jgi:phage virion morphogenesis protein
MQFRIQVRLDDISAEVARWGASLDFAGQQKLLRAMGTQMQSLTKDAFVNEQVRPRPWAALSASTLKQKAGRGSTLRRTGALWQSIALTKGIIGNQISVTTDRPYAAVHQFGSEKARGRGSGIPPRPFFPFLGKSLLIPTDLLERRITAIGQAALDAALRRG